MRGSMTHRVARHRRRVPGAFAVVALAAALAVAGCGNSSSTNNEASSSGGGTGSGPDPTLTVSLGQYTAVQPALFLGQALGLYKKAGVNVDFQLNGTDFATDVLAGRADVAISGPAGALAAAFQGKDTAVLAEVTRGTPNGIVVKTGSPYTSIMDLSGATVAGYAPGTSSYGAVQLVSHYIVAHGGKPLISKATSSASGVFVDQVVSGAVDASSEVPEGAAPYIKTGKARWLVAPDNPVMAKIMTPDMVGYSVWTLRSNIASKRTAVVRFMAGMRLAWAWLKTHSDAQVATELAKVPGFQQLLQADPGLLKTVVPQERVFWPTAAGYISQTRWDKVTLPVWKQWALPYNLNSATASWKQRVDMSYWQQASGLVKTLQGSSS
jgi:ABC-type nitrate/sulfonate/bicarbonate transport system substrate-binding protein